MSELARYNPTGRFTGLAESYARCRPTYPQAALDFILAHCDLGPGSLVVDVGCGTGISSRLFAAREPRVLGVEPNDEMRCLAEATPPPPGVPPPVYRKGRAEETGLADRSANAVLAAQAFHWFEPEASFREFRRILKPRGWVVLMWNEHDLGDPFTAAFDALVFSAPEAASVEVPRRQSGEVLLVSPRFVEAERRVFANEQTLDEDGLLGRAFSASYAPREEAAAQVFAAKLREVFRRFQRNALVVLRYETSVYVARLPG
jgi:ubiquinone/menaquinone biosynthesis C-methylase UbiE